MDKGEWRLLEALQMKNKLTDIMTMPWQLGLSEDSDRKSVSERYTELLGNDDYQKLLEVQKWISGHEHKKDILKYLELKS
jgi:hypothetical protein